MNIKNFIKFILILVLSIFFISCNNKTPITKDTLHNREFSLISPTKSDNVTIRFEGDAVFGNGGVNRFFGTFNVIDNQVTFGPLGSTMMAGPEEAMTLESNVLRTISTSKEVTLSKSILTITSEDGNVIKFREIQQSK